MPSTRDRNDEQQREAVLLKTTALSALAQLIPVPFVDDVVRTRLHRGMVRSLANLHGLRIWPDEVEVLVDTPSALLTGLAKGAVLYPVKRLLRQVFVVLRFKSMVDHASDTYHRGLLIDHAFATRRCAPLGPYTPAEIRAAIDAVCRESPLADSPVTEAVSVGLSRSRRGLAQAVELAQRRFGRPSADADDERIARAVDEQERDPVVGSIVDQLRHALEHAPREHLEVLRARLGERLPLGSG